MSEKKVLSINPDLFSFNNNNTTKKKKEKVSQNKINIKPEKKSSLKDTMKKRSILRMIRQHQNEKYENLLNKKNNEMVKPTNTESIITNDFKHAETYLTNLTNESPKERPREVVNTHNYTIKQPVQNYQENIRLQPIQSEIEPVTIQSPISSVVEHNIKPQYGCLKNGSLPTYRSYMNQTRKQLPTHINTNNSIVNEKNEDRINNILERQSLNLQYLDKNQNRELKKRPKKRKKIIRRTFKIGKSNKKPKISILVSNKTLRNNTATKKQLLKQTPILDIKRYLIKHGFIKIGSICPDDLMRKMYESAVLICGEVQNHNADNLLHNYLNSNDDH
tara:strand:+ start:1366 stop:2364 length:999 start_codon:yes stop_codon:yes gene_type:complete